MVLHWCHCLVSSCSTTGRFLPAGPVAAEPAVQFSANFDRSGHKVLRKAEQLVQRVGGHALAAFVDRKHNCHMYASSALQALFDDVSAIEFICDELVHKQHPGMLLFPVVMRSKQLPKAEVFDQDPNTRHKTWKQRWSTLEAFTNQLAECHPDKAFCLYVQSGKDLQTLTTAARHLPATWVAAFCSRTTKTSRSAGSHCQHHLASDRQHIYKAACYHIRPACQKRHTGIGITPCQRITPCQHAKA